MSESGSLEALETWIGRIFRAGVGASAALIGLGVILWAVSGDAGFALDAFPLGFGAILTGALAGRPLAVIQAGLILLMMTPLFRVGAAALLFAREGDRLYASISLAVFLLLMIMLVTGGGGE